MSAEADRIVRRIYAGTMSLSKAAMLIDDMLAEERKKAANRAIIAMGYLDLDGDLRDLDYMKAAILGKDTP